MTLDEKSCNRIYSGDHPVRVWREFLGMDQAELRRMSGVRVEELEKIETGKKRLTEVQARKIARALDIARHNLTHHHEHYSSCAALDVDEDEILARAE